MSSQRQPCASPEPARRLKEHLRARRERVDSLRSDLLALLRTEAETSREASRAATPEARARAGSRSPAVTDAAPRSTRDAIRAARGQLGVVRALGTRLR